MMVVPGSYLTNGLQAYWSFDEASGTRADLTGNGHDLFPSNAVATVSVPLPPVTVQVCDGAVGCASTVTL